jgi:hypothetical protein
LNHRFIIELSNDTLPKNKFWSVDLSDVKYIIYPKGKILVYVDCSDKPFKQETDNDESSLFGHRSQYEKRTGEGQAILREKVE